MSFKALLPAYFINK
uniref:Uncharacterized protein n=1 Tax=Arundo donax TaxID=35708 RepID=A0A0A9B7J2_ARUDO